MEVSILGRIGYDLYAEDHNVPLQEVTRFARYLGGSSANMAVGLRRLGLQAGIISCLGTDPLSQYLIDYLQKEGVGTRFVRRKAGYLPSLCLTEISPPDSFPQVFYREKPVDTQVEIGEEERAFISQTRLFITNGTSLCASPSRECTYLALQWARSGGLKVAFDVDYREMSWQSPQEAGVYARLALPYIDFFIANPEEICLVAEMEQIDAAVDRLLGWGVAMIVAKLGNRGTKVITATGSLFLPPYPVEVLSTIGAGDGFASGFLYGLIKNKPLATALKYGNAAAAIVVSRLMCSEAMPTLAEVEELIARHSDMKVEAIPACGPSAQSAGGIASVPTND